ncbi:hypothetical protein [Streptomyces sp. BR123]|uniref:hypothetical protein n=1 Tax=Streptomyces sp. BR123 TaxID=2749828 RepID=UPI00211AF27A|nr:hypothetical protein [Streptomyces sp. BR123]
MTGRKPGRGREQVPSCTRGRVIALTKTNPPAGTGLTHWSTRTLAGSLKRREGISVSWYRCKSNRRAMWLVLQS